MVKQLKADYKLADISPSQMAMLDYAAKLTSRPSDMIESDLIKLRNTGFNDRSILDINQIISYFAYVNRVADGLGVDLEDFWDKK